MRSTVKRGYFDLLEAREEAFYFLKNCKHKVTSLTSPPIPVNLSLNFSKYVFTKFFLPAIVYVY